MCWKLTNWRYICHEWRLWIRPLLIVLYVIFAIIIVPLLIVNSVKDGFKRKDQLILIGGLFVLSAVPISIWHITQHLIHFTKPILQKHIIRILWMVPIYALNAWLGLLFPEHSIYVDSLRDCYEAYVIYNFMVYLLNYLNLSMDLEATLEQKPQVKHFFPLCCMRPWEMGREFIHNCKHGILQYTVIKPIMTFIAFICELCGVYGEGSFKTNVAFTYIIIVNNVTQFVAMYCLVLFYRANKIDLKPMRPIPKFLCIKAVIFFSFFQSVIIYILVYFGYIKNIFGQEEDPNNYKGLASELQNFLICIEMFIAAIAHIYSFPHEPFHINDPQYWQAHANWFDALLSMLDISDVQQDVSEHLGVVGSSLSRRFRGRTNYYVPRGSESSYLISPISTQTNIAYQSGLKTGNEYSISNTKFSEKIKNRYGATDNTTTTTTAGSNNLIQFGGGGGGSGGVRTSKGLGVSDSNTCYDDDGGIQILNKKDLKEYSPHFGAAPTSAINYLQNRQKSQNSTSTTKNDLLTAISHTPPTTSSSSSRGADAGRRKNKEDDSTTSSSRSSIKKSDSNTSDWLSTPTDDIIGIDVRGIEKDHIKIHPPPPSDPKI